MSPKQRRQALASSPEQDQRAFDAAHRAPKLRGWITIAQAAEDLCFTVTAPSDPEKACREWLKREGIATVRRGRVILVDRFDLERALRKVS